MKIDFSKCRYLATGKVRRLADSVLANPKASCSSVNHKVVNSPARLPLILSGVYSQWKFSSNFGYAWCAIHEAKEALSNSRSFKTAVLFSNYNKLFHAQATWKRLFYICSCSGPILSPLSKAACAISFALSRSQLVGPGILAFFIGHLACSDNFWAEAEGFPTRDSVRMHALDGSFCPSTCFFFLLEGVILFMRAVYLVILFSPCIVMAPFSESFGSEYRRSWLQIVRITLEKAGPAFIKWGQWAATRPDLFPNDLCNELSRLHTRAPAHSYGHTERTIENAFGRKLMDIFENFEEEPVASGSVAQVHRATLRFQYPGKKVEPILVAVKVRHPGVQEAIRRDFMLINLFAKFSKFIPALKWMRLDESLRQFGVFMMSQVDLAREAANLNRFIYNFRRWKDVSFPKPLYPLVHPAVLVETFEQGDNVLHYVDKVKGHDQVGNSLARIGTNALLQMLLVDNFIHADMHPGNILIRVSRGKPSPKSMFKLRPHIVFLDVGMTTELSEKDRSTLLEFFKSVAVRDGRTAANCTLRLSRNQSCPNPEAFVREVENTFSFWGTAEGGSFHAAECMQQMLEQVRHHQVNIDGNVCTVLVTTLVLEAWQRKLDPEYDVLVTLQNLLFKADLAESFFYTIECLMAP